MSKIVKTPEPPYYAVIFTSLRSKGENGYNEIADRMVEQASQRLGYLGMESARETVGITVSYWSDLESIKAWKQNAEHLIAQKQGREVWFQAYRVRISAVERDYGFSNPKEEV